MEILREKWMWNREVRRIWLWAFVVCGLALTVALYPSQGHAALALGALPLGATAALIGVIYGYVGKKVQALKESLAGEQGYMTEALVQVGSIQSPAIAILKGEELVLVTLVGERVAIPLADIRSVREGSNLYGKGFIWKRAFKIEAPQSERLGLAVAPSVADRWRGRLMQARR
jgi:hypothetical protein